MTRSRAGFTLLELVAVIVILGLTGTGVLAGLSKAADFYRESEAENDLASQTWIAMERISRELSAASSIGAQEPVQSPTVGSSSQNLTFTKASCAQCVDNSQSVTFMFDNTAKTIIRQTQQSQETLADNVTAFTVSADSGASNARIYTITITRMAKNERALTVETSVYPPASRNSSWSEIVR